METYDKIMIITIMALCLAASLANMDGQMNDHIKKYHAPITSK